MSDDGMSPEELESLYNGPSAGSGPEAGWQPPRVPPPPERESEREPPAWKDPDQHQDRHDAAIREEQRLEALRALTVRVRSEERQRQAQLEADLLERQRRQDHEHDMELARREEEAAARQREHEARLERFDRERLDFERAQQRGEELERLQQGLARQWHSVGPPKPFSQTETFVLGFLAGAAGASLYFVIRERLRDGRRTW